MQNYMYTVLAVALLTCSSWAKGGLTVQEPDLYESFQADSCDFRHYAALGDSYAAGINADPKARLPICDGKNGGDSGPYCTTKTCAKNTASYPWMIHQTYQKTEMYFDFFACSGAKTADCAALQVPRINSSTDLITINIGGNNGDMFARIVTLCVYLIGQFGCSSALSGAETTISNIEPDLRSLIGELNVRAPQAKVAVMSYVRFWPEGQIDPKKCKTRSLKRPSQDQKTLMNTLVVRLNGVLSKVATDVQAEYIDVNPYFENHRLCDDDESFIEYKLSPLPGFDEGDDDGILEPDLSLYNKGVFHPFKTGHQQYLRAFAERFGCT